MSRFAAWIAALRARNLVLLASLALNIFFIAGIVAVLLHRGPPPAPPEARGPAARIERLAASLPPEDGRKVRIQFQISKPDFEVEWETLRQAQDEVRRALRATPFDPAAVDAALNDLWTAHGAVRTTFQDAMMRAVADMSPQGRARLAERFPIHEGGPPPPDQKR